MPEEISSFSKFFRAELLGISDVSSYVGTNLFNTYAPARTVFPYGIFKIVPLGDVTGQARTSIMTRLLVDLKFVTGLPVDPKIYDAVKSAKEHFRESLTFDADGFRISIRHDRPIEIPEFGATPDERLMNIGSTYAVWITGTQ